MNRKQIISIISIVCGIILIIASQTNLFYSKKTITAPPEKDPFGYASAFGKEKEKYLTVLVPNNALIYSSLSIGILLIIIGGYSFYKNNPFQKKDN